MPERKIAKFASDRHDLLPEGFDHAWRRFSDTVMQANGAYWNSNLLVVHLFQSPSPYNHLMLFSSLLSDRIKSLSGFGTYNDAALVVPLSWAHSFFALPQLLRTLRGTLATNGVPSLDTDLLSIVDEDGEDDLKRFDPPEDLYQTRIIRVAGLEYLFKDLYFALGKRCSSRALAWKLEEAFLDPSLKSPFDIMDLLVCRNLAKNFKGDLPKLQIAIGLVGHFFERLYAVASDSFQDAQKQHPLKMEENKSSFPSLVH